jgi:hypothetical protein
MKGRISDLIRFNPPGSWPNHELCHDIIMHALKSLNRDPVVVPRRQFHPNDDGTFTPLSRGLEWNLQARVSMGFEDICIG